MSRKTRFQVELQLARITKNKFMYVELDSQGRPLENPYKGKVGNFYVSQSEFNGMRPDKITLTVETHD